MFCLLVVLVRLSVPVQAIDWKDSSPKWPIMCWWGRWTLLTHSLNVHRPSLAANASTYSVQTVHTGQQVCSLCCAVVVGTHGRSYVVNITGRHWSSFSRPLWPDRYALLACPIGISHFCHFWSCDLWNSLPTTFTVRDLSLTFTLFCSRLKTKLHSTAHGEHYT